MNSLVQLTIGGKDVLKGIYTFITRKDAINENLIFRLHYRLPVLFILYYLIVMIPNIYLTERIICYDSTDNVRNIKLESYCSSGTVLPVQNPHGNLMKYTFNPLIDICFALQVFLFYIPRILWEQWPHNKIKLLRKMRKSIENREAFHMTDIVSEFEEKENYLYIGGYFFCEFLSFGLLFFQKHIIDYIFVGSFSWYGYDILKAIILYDDGITDPLYNHAFPTIVNCTLPEYYTNAHTTNKIGFCDLPVNNLNRTIFAIIWFWLAFLFILTGFIVLYRTLILLTLSLRTFTVLPFANSSINKSEALQKILEKCDIGGWLLLKRLSQNCNEEDFKRFLEEKQTRINSSSTSDQKTSNNTKSKNDSENEESV